MRNEKEQVPLYQMSENVQSKGLSFVKLKGFYLFIYLFVNEYNDRKTFSNSLCNLLSPNRMQLKGKMLGSHLSQLFGEKDVCTHWKSSSTLTSITDYKNS